MTTCKHLKPCDLCHDDENHKPLPMRRGEDGETLYECRQGGHKHEFATSAMICDLKKGEV